MTAELYFCKGKAPEHVEPNYVDCENAVVYGNGMKFIILTKVHSTDGTVSQTDKGLTIENASESVLITAIETEFTGWNKPFLNNWKELTDRCQKRLNCAGKYDFEGLKKRHERIHKSYFERVKIHIASGEESDTGLYEHLFQYGRYLMIASSRGMNLPNNLQGIWNGDNAPPWECDIHSNINIQMNYWPAEVCNLSECHEPFIRYIATEALRPGGSWQQLARSEGLRGWTVNTQNNIFGYTDWNINRPANAWYCMHLWKHYAYTQDINYLRSVPIRSCAVPVNIGLTGFN